MGDKYRDPVHGFIEVTDLENEIINSTPFQRLRNVKQLAMTYLVFHGAEHTRFGHSIGVMHLVTRAFDSAVSNGSYSFSDEKYAWYKQLLRLIALTHDLGHAPFSHASEAVFPDGLEHEDFTEKIVKETIIATHIKAIGATFVEKYGPEYDITPDTILTKPVNIGAAAPLSQEGGLPYQTYMRLRVSNRIRMACLETWKI